MKVKSLSRVRLFAIPRTVVYQASLSMGFSRQEYWSGVSLPSLALTRQTFVGKVMSLYFNMLYRFIKGFLPRSKHLLISWQQSLSVVILEHPKIKSATVSTVSPSICHEVMGPMP